MKLDFSKSIPKTFTVKCPSCENTEHSMDENQMTVCSNCNLELHKDELIELNRDKAISEINTKKLAKDITQQLKKQLKGFK